MPPAGSPRPDDPTYRDLIARLEDELDRAAAQRPNPGRPILRRLNRFEYANAIRDVLSLTIDASALLPADESGYGFDNIGDVLSLSPGLLDRYMIAAREISRLAVGDSTLGATTKTYQLSRHLNQDERLSDELPAGSRGGAVIRHYFPLDGEYEIRVTLARSFNNDAILGIAHREQLDLRLDDQRLQLFAVGGECVDSRESRCRRPPGLSFIFQVSDYELTA